jgi:hypothetical protein
MNQNDTEMINKPMSKALPSSTGSRLVNADRLLEILFEPESRPSMRWVRNQQKAKTIPFYKIGHLVYFDPAEVKESLRVNALPQTMGRWNTQTGGIHSENNESSCPDAATKTHK